MTNKTKIALEELKEEISSSAIITQETSKGIREIILDKIDKKIEKYQENTKTELGGKE